MTAKELIAFLQTLPEETEVLKNDSEYGPESFDALNLEVTTDTRGKTTLVIY